MQLTNIRRAAFCLSLFGTGSIFGWLQVGKPGPSVQQIEITEADLLSVKDWDSLKLEIWGLHLGMSRKSANLAIRKRNLQLVQLVQLRPQPFVDADQCEVRTSLSDGLYVGPTIRFGKSGNILEITVPRIPDYA